MSARDVLAHAASPRSRARRRRRRVPRLGIPLLIAIVALILVAAAFGPLLAPHDPNVGNLLEGVQGPSGSHLLGTDDSGRDIFSRVLVGARSAVVGPAIIALAAALLGSLLGLTAGYYGGWRDAATMRFVDLMYAVPGLLFTIILLGVLGGGYAMAIAVLVFLTCPSDTRIIRGAALEQRALPYVDAARALGLSPRRIMFRHIWPNVLPLIVANAFLDFASSLVTLSAVSFLGLGASPGSADWGRMLNDNISLLDGNALAALAPGIALVLTAVSMNQLGDWTYERLSRRGRAR